MRSLKRLQPIAVRSVRANQFTLDDANLKVSGYVNETGKQSDPIPNFGEVPDDGSMDVPDEFVEIMQPGVFSDAIKNADFVDFYFEHEPDKYLASTREGTLNLSEDSTGLKMSATITPTSWGKDAYTLIKSGAVKSMSFGFIPLEDSWDLSGDMPVRTVTKIQLLEVSAVRFPAYPDSSIDARKKRFNHLNKIFEKRGYTLRTTRKSNKRGVKHMVKSTIKKSEKRDNGTTTSADAQAIANAVNNLANAVDNNTNAVQEQSEVQSNMASQIMQAANADRSNKSVKEDVNKSEKRAKSKSTKETKKSEKSDDSKEEVKSKDKPKKETNSKEKSKEETNSKDKSKDEDKEKDDDKRTEKCKDDKRSSAKYAKMFKELEHLDA